MIINRRTTYVIGKALNATRSVTKEYIHLNDGPSVPVGFNIPVPGGSTGLTVLYYTRLVSKDFEQYRIYIDGSDGVGGGLHSQEFSIRGIFGVDPAAADYGFRYNGVKAAGGTRYIYYDGTWGQITLKTVGNTSPRRKGSLHFNVFAGSNSPNDGLPAVDYAYVLIYQRELSDEEINRVLPPTDYSQIYTFAGYKPGDTILTEQNGTGLDGQYIYP